MPEVRSPCIQQSVGFSPLFSPQSKDYIFYHFLETHSTLGVIRVTLLLVRVIRNEIVCEDFVLYQNHIHQLCVIFLPKILSRRTFFALFLHITSVKGSVADPVTGPQFRIASHLFWSAGSGSAKMTHKNRKIKKFVF